MKTKVLTLALCALSLNAMAVKKNIKQLEFDASKGKQMELTMPRGELVRYTAYEHLYFVTNVEDTTYQYLNIYIPEGATEATPIFLRTYVGGYMRAKRANLRLQMQREEL
jgi:hypothetical protein